MMLLLHKATSFCFSHDRKEARNTVEIEKTKMEALEVPKESLVFSKALQTGVSEMTD